MERRGVKAIAYKTPEEIRKGLGLSQPAFAEKIGMGMRSYCYRIKDSGTHSRWYFDEIAEIAQLNGGEIRVQTEKGTFNVKFFGE